MQSTVWKVSVAQGHYLIVARSAESARQTAERYAGGLKVVSVERHVPRRWPDPEVLRAAYERRERARVAAQARRRAA